MKTDELKKDTITTHKAAIEALYDLDPETQAYQLRISNFLLKHPKLAGISYASADLLISEKNIEVRQAAIKCITVEIQHRANVDMAGFRLTHRKVTENRVRKILHAERLKKDSNSKILKTQNIETILECPFCKKKITYKRITRDNVIAFRTTEVTDNAITHLANECNISRSRLISELLFIERRFGSMRI